MLRIIAERGRISSRFPGFTWGPRPGRMYALSRPRARARDPRWHASCGSIADFDATFEHARHQPGPAERIPAAELPGRPADQPRRLLDRVPGVRRRRAAGRHQGIPALVAGAA